MTDNELDAIDPAFRALLRDRGATDGDIANAARAGHHFLAAFAAELLICPPGPHTLADVALLVGVAEDQVAQSWRALGLADPSTGAVRFSDDDVQVLQTIAVLAAMLPSDMVADLTRVFGASAQQFAHASVNALRVGFEQPLRTTGSSDTDVELAYGEIANEIIPGVIGAWGTLLRHHLVVSTYEDVAISEDGSVQSEQTIVFVDLVDFTGLSQRVDVAELATVLSAFEAGAAETAARHRGHLVKLLGDGAMLRFSARVDAINAARELVATKPDQVARRAGVATGRVLTRQGDFYGPVVNLAARLSGAVAPGEVAVDTATALADGELVSPIALKGIDAPVGFYRIG